MADLDQRYMQMALKLAQRGIGSVEPNPAVGCVIVKANQIIGKGWHRKFGEAHAEVNALEDCKDLGISPRGATMYVTLEPCCHQGKTGPCTKSIIEAGLGKVVVATIDPSQHANGKGVAELQQAGIEMSVGLCQTQARLLNAPFIKYAATGRCWVTLKWAQTIDGRVSWAGQPAAPGDQRCWISNELSRKDSHGLRRRAGAILVGINTVIADNPLLTPRPSRGKSPIRVVLDSHLRIPLGCRLLRTARKVPVLIVASEAALRAEAGKAARISKKGAELLGYPSMGRSDLRFVLEQLSLRGISYLVVEGGPTVLASFLKEQLADEVCVYIAPRILGRHGGADVTAALADLGEVVDLRHVRVDPIGEDICLRGLTQKALGEISVTQ